MADVTIQVKDNGPLVMSIEIATEKIELEDASLSILTAGEGETVVLIPSWARGNSTDANYSGSQAL